GHLTLGARVPAFLGSVLDCGRRARWHRPSSASLPDRVVYLSLREGGIAAAGSNTAAGCSGQRAARSAQPGPGGRITAMRKLSKTLQMNRVDFPSATRQIIADRAGH